MENLFIFKILWVVIDLFIGGFMIGVIWLAIEKGQGTIFMPNLANPKRFKIIYITGLVIVTIVIIGFGLIIIGRLENNIKNSEQDGAANSLHATRSVLG